MTLDADLRLVDWTGRQVRREKKGAIPADLAPVLDRLQIPGESCLELIARFGCVFQRTTGWPGSLRRDAQKGQMNRSEGIVNCPALFAWHSGLCDARVGVTRLVMDRQIGCEVSAGRET